jgi:hypothetical protein
MTTHTIRPVGFDANIAAGAFRHYAKDFYAAYANHKSGPRFSPARFFLLMRSIELAGKALHVGQGRDTKALRKIGHDLIAACDRSILSAYRVTLDAAEEQELKKANKYYDGKGFEYFWFDCPGVPTDRSGPQQMLSGWPDLPDENILETVLQKLLRPNL